MGAIPVSAGMLPPPKRKPVFGKWASRPEQSAQRGQGAFSLWIVSAPPSPPFAKKTKFCMPTSIRDPEFHTGGRRETGGGRWKVRSKGGGAKGRVTESGILSSDKRGADKADPCFALLVQINGGVLDFGVWERVVSHKPSTSGKGKRLPKRGICFPSRAPRKPPWTPHTEYVHPRGKGVPKAPKAKPNLNEKWVTKYLYFGTDTYGTWIPYRPSPAGRLGQPKRRRRMYYSLTCILRRWVTKQAMYGGQW
jgi:hypothetical protein